MFDDVITLHAEYLDGGSTGVISANADEARLYTEDGTFIAVWQRVNTDGWVTWVVTTSDVMDDDARADLSGYRSATDAVNAAVAWFRANGGVPDGYTVELDS